MVFFLIQFVFLNIFLGLSRSLPVTPFQRQTPIRLEDTKSPSLLTDSITGVFKLTGNIDFQTTEQPSIQTTQQPPIQTTQLPPIQTTRQPPIQTTQLPPIQTTRQPPIQTTKLPAFQTNGEGGNGETLNFKGQTNLPGGSITLLPSFLTNKPTILLFFTTLLNQPTNLPQVTTNLLNGGFQPTPNLLNGGFQPTPNFLNGGFHPTTNLLNGGFQPTTNLLNGGLRPTTNFLVVGTTLVPANPQTTIFPPTTTLPPTTTIPTTQTTATTTTKDTSIKDKANILGSAFYPGKTRWPELKGETGERAKEVIEEERPDLKVWLVHEGDVITEDFRTDRVWIFLDGEMNVIRIPVIG